MVVQRQSQVHAASLSQGTRVMGSETCDQCVSPLVSHSQTLSSISLSQHQSTGNINYISLPTSNHQGSPCACLLNCSITIHTFCLLQSHGEQSHKMIQRHASKTARNSFNVRTGCMALHRSAFNGLVTWLAQENVIHATDLQPSATCISLSTDNRQLGRSNSS
jgi:hypothetical protein